MTEWEGIVRRVDESDGDFNVFTEEALAAQDGKVVPLTLEIGGPVIGEATLKYDSDERALKTIFRVDDPNLAELLKGTPPNIFG